MKLYKLLTLALGVIFLASCGNEYDVNEYFDLEELPPYVAFDASGNDATVDPVDVVEGGATSLFVEAPTGTKTDITVNYSLGGSAVFGEDYTIEGASASGGSITISSDRGNFNETFRASIDIVALDNPNFDLESRVIEITLTDASRSEGEIVVGRGGTDLLKSQTVTILDDECESEYAGSYMAVASSDSLIINGMLMDTVRTLDTIMTTVFKQSGEYFSYTVEDGSAGGYAGFFGGSALELDFTEDCGGVVAADVTDEFGETVSVIAAGISGGVINMTLKRANGEQFNVTFIPSS